MPIWPWPIYGLGLGLYMALHFTLKTLLVELYGFVFIAIVFINKLYTYSYSY